MKRMDKYLDGMMTQNADEYQETYELSESILLKSAATPF